MKELAFETPVESGVQTEAAWFWFMFNKQRQGYLDSMHVTSLGHYDLSLQIYKLLLIKFFF